MVPAFANLDFLHRSVSKLKATVIPLLPELFRPPVPISLKNVAAERQPAKKNQEEEVKMDQ